MARSYVKAVSGPKSLPIKGKGASKGQGKGAAMTGGSSLGSAVPARVVSGRFQPSGGATPATRLSHKKLVNHSKMLGC